MLQQGGGMSPGAVSAGHLVVFDAKELQLLIIANSEYNLDVEGEVGTTQWQLREEALEKHVVERSVLLLTNIPTNLHCHVMSRLETTQPILSSKLRIHTKQTYQLKPSARFFSGRPLIDDKLAPRFFYQDDNLRGDKISLAEVIEQEPLPSGLSAQLDLELRHVVDVCNILKLAETTRDFLRVTGGDRHESLFKRMKKLRLAPTADVTQHLNQVGRQCAM